MVVRKAKNILPPPRKPSEKPNETPYYRLPLYNSGTYANLKDGYNLAMWNIERKLHEFETRIKLLENVIILEEKFGDTEEEED